MCVQTSPADMRRLRLETQMLVASGDRSVAAIAGRLLAMQAQNFNASLWALASRRGDFAVRGDVYSSFDAGEIVRSWTMRNTLHVVASQDLRWMLSLDGNAHDQSKRLAASPERT